MKKAFLASLVFAATVISVSSAQADFRGFYQYFGHRQAPMAPQQYAPQVPSYATSTPSRYYNGSSQGHANGTYYTGPYNPYNNGR